MRENLRGDAMGVELEPNKANEKSRGIFEMNHVCVRCNPTVWSHDPSMLWAPVTKRFFSCIISVTGQRSIEDMILLQN